MEYKTYREFYDKMRELKFPVLYSCWKCGRVICAPLPPFGELGICEECK